MPQTRNHFTLFLLPAIMFGYAAYSNIKLIAENGINLSAAANTSVSMSTMLDGEITMELDTLYKKELPHRDFAVGLGGNARYAVFGAGRRGVVVGSEGWLFTNEEFKHIEHSSIADAVERIASIKRELEAKGIALVVVPLPAKSDIYSDYVQSRMKSDSMSRAYADFLSNLTTAGIETVNIKPDLISGMTQGGVFLKSDTHWSPPGAKIAAAATSKVVQSLGLDMEPGTVSVASPKPVSVWGDLTKFITLPTYAQNIGFQPETVELYQTEMATSGADIDLFGDNTAVPVVLVGTSYSANENWSFASFLRQSLSVDVVSVAKDGLGPGIPMLDYLRSEQIASTPPKLVIWEFPVRYLGTKNLWERPTKSGTGSPHSPAGGSNV